MPIADDPLASQDLERPIGCLLAGFGGHELRGGDPRPRDAAGVPFPRTVQDQCSGCLQLCTASAQHGLDDAEPGDLLTEPAPGSVRANEVTHRPVAMSLRYLSFWASVPWSWRIWEQRPMVVENRDR